jgi:hypothetical protein
MLILEKAIVQLGQQAKTIKIQFVRKQTKKNTARKYNLKKNVQFPEKGKNDFAENLLISMCNYEKIQTIQHLFQFFLIYSSLCYLFINSQ